MGPSSMLSALYLKIIAFSVSQLTGVKINVRINANMFLNG